MLVRTRIFVDLLVSWQPRGRGAVPVVQVLAGVGIIQAVQVINTGHPARPRSRDTISASRRRDTAALLDRLRCRPAVGRDRRRDGVRHLQHAGRTRPDRARRGALNVLPMVFSRETIAGVCPGCAGMRIACSGVWRNFLVDAGVGAEGRLVLCIMAGVLVYGLSRPWRFPEPVVEVRGVSSTAAVAPAFRGPQHLLTRSRWAIGDPRARRAVI